MRYPTADDPELMDLINRYVSGSRRYMKLLHGNFAMLADPERTNFLQLLSDAATQITDHELRILLDTEWRSRITAAWLIGVSRREQFRRQLGELLLESRLVFAGQGYCFALARFGTSADADTLVAYLHRYLPQLHLRYDQEWALGALQHLDARLNTNHAPQFLNGPWQQWATANRITAIDQKQRIDTLVAAVGAYSTNAPASADE